MTKSKSESTAEIKLPPQGLFSRPSMFGGQKNRPGGPKFSIKAVSTRPTFVTQHKGGGGK